MAKPHPENATSRVGNIARIQTDATLVEEDVINFWEVIIKLKENKGNFEQLVLNFILNIGSR